MVLAAQIREQSLAHTVQVLPDARKDGGDFSLFDAYARGPLLPARATQQRERYLRDNVYYHDYNWMLRGTCAGVMKKVASTSFEIKGPGKLSYTKEKVFKQAAAIMGFALPGEQRVDIEYYQQVFRLADFGAGWTNFVQQGVDYLRQDRGWIWEAIYPGDPTSDPIGPLMGIAHVDSLKCRPTGDPIFPMLYFDKHGQKHLLRYTHVRQLVDMPDGDERRPGYGDCATSRAVSIIHREILGGRYVEAALDDKPPPGFMRMQGITKNERERAFLEYRKEQNFDERPEWGRIIFFHGMDKDTPVEIESIAFSEAPEKFDFKTYTEVDANALALAFGIDVQEIWQLTGGSLGSEGQSDVLHQKSRGKTIGTLYADMERNANDLISDEYEFKFKQRDAEESLEDAQIANEWVTVVSGAGSNLQPDEARQILANKVEAIKDAITDENGQIRRVDDLGVQPQEQVADDTSVLNLLGNQSGGMPGDGAQTLLPRLGGVKAIQSTRLDFESDFADAITAAQNDEMNRRRFGIVARALLRRHGQRAYLDGLADGGVEQDSLDESDLDIFSGWLVEQSGYVTDFADALFDDATVTPESKASVWFNRSIMPIYGEGVKQADLNGLYELVGDDGEESCKDCQRLKGQVHRLRGWDARGWWPFPNENTECGGFNCAHLYVKATGRAQGNF